MKDIISIVFKAYNNLYGESEFPYRFEWVDGLRRRNWLFFKTGSWGFTDFNESPPVIGISIDLPIKHSLEIIAHELAHVVAGLDAGHGLLWENAFVCIHEEYHKILDAEHNRCLTHDALDKCASDL